MSIREIKRERRMLIELVVVIILIGLFVNILANALYNMFPRIALWAVVSVFAILLLSFYILFTSRFFVFKIKETIPFVFAFDRKESFIPFFELWGSPLSFASSYLRTIITKKPELKKKLDSRSKEFDNKFFLDLTAFLVLSWLFQHYPFCWLYERPVKYSFRKFERGIEKPSVKIKYSDLQGDWQNNIFSILGEPNFQMTLPPKTTISIKKEENKWVISMKNRYCKILLGIHLFSWSHFWMLQDVPVRFSSKERQKEFETFDFFIDFEGKFSRIWSWTPQMNDYYEWAEGIFERLRDDFDWRIQVQKIRSVLEALDSRYFKL